MKEDWTKEMKRKLEEHRMDPPSGLWEDICEQMDLSTSPVQKPTLIKRWHLAFAAGLLALVGFFTFYHQDNSLPLSQPSATTQVLEKINHESIPSASTPSKPFSSNPANLIAQKRQTNISVREVAHNDTIIESIHEKEKETEQVAVEKAENKPSVEHPTTSVIENDFMTSERPIKRSTNSDNWSLGINASGGLFASNNIVNGTSYGSFPNNFYYVGIIGKYPNSSYETPLGDYVWKHQLPLCIGLSLQYQLNQHVAVVSGINYTYLSSEFSIPSIQNANYEQKLHYLGIPLGISWQLLANRHFRFYLSGGGMLEKCIRSTLSLEHRQDIEKPWQWSVYAAAGAEYTFTNQFGIYFEPSLNYFFNDNTSLEHYYKEHPLTPAIEFGIRLHLKK